MDHICYRCATIEEYKEMCGALTQDHGVCIVEGMIGGRPISTIQVSQMGKAPFFSPSY
jgi:predicted metalloenzyme YecM